MGTWGHDVFVFFMRRGFAFGVEYRLNLINYRLLHLY